VQDSADAWHFHTDDASMLQGLPQQVVDRAVADAGKHDHSGFWLNLDFPTYHAVVTHADSRELRKRYYRAWSTRASDVGEHSSWDNSDNMQRILALRHAAAGLVGFSNYAEYSLATKMAAETEQVMSFLRELAGRTRATADAELGHLLLSGETQTAEILDFRR
jgi:oligopeptidase A